MLAALFFFFLCADVSTFIIWRKETPGIYAVKDDRKCFTGAKRLLNIIWMKIVSFF